MPYYDNNTLLHKIVLAESWSSPVNSIRVEMRKKFNSIVIVGTSSPLSWLKMMLCSPLMKSNQFIANQNRANIRNIYFSPIQLQFYPLRHNRSKSQEARIVRCWLVRGQLNDASRFSISFFLLRCRLLIRSTGDFSSINLWSARRKSIELNCFQTSLALCHRIFHLFLIRMHAVHNVQHALARPIDWKF